jgi:hypothetical protein
MDGEACQHLRVLDLANRHRIDQQRMAAVASLENLRRVKHEDKAATMAEVARSSKVCPKKGCGAHIQRVQGCSHMQCPVCSTHFCWPCKVMWKDKNTVLHVDTCPVGNTTTIALASLDTSDYAPGWNVDEGYDTSADPRQWLISSQR